MEISFDTTLDKWKGDGGWYFLYLPKNCHKDIKEISSQEERRGFGAVKVEVTVGGSVWKTSVFPDADKKQYILFIKKSVRTAEKLAIGSKVEGVAKLLL